MGDEELWIILSVDGDPVTLLHAPRGEQRREAVGAVVQLSLGDRPVEVPEGVAFGDAFRRLLEEVCHATLWQRQLLGYVAASSPAAACSRI